MQRRRGSPQTKRLTKTGSMTGNQNLDDASSTKSVKTYENGGVAPWSDLIDDMLLLVMMQLGVIDFLAFSGVCKSWRSVALTNKKKFMVSKPPMSISISPEKEACYLEDFEGRKFKTILPHFGGRTCVGLTCGYLILFGEKTHDFWLVNPITRHALHFPDVTFGVYRDERNLVAILVFSPPIREWVFVVLHTNKIWFSIAGKGAWTHISTPFFIHDLHAFKGKIYTLHTVLHSCEVSCLGEIILYPEPKLMLLETKNCPKQGFALQFVRSGEKLYMMDRMSENTHELDFRKMKWVSCEKTIQEYALFLSDYKLDAVVIQDPLQEYKRYVVPDTGGKGRKFYAKMWYFFHDCLNE